MKHCRSRSAVSKDKWLYLLFRRLCLVHNYGNGTCLYDRGWGWGGGLETRTNYSLNKSTSSRTLNMTNGSSSSPRSGSYDNRQYTCHVVYTK